jgi:hypothetical protein
MIYGQRPPRRELVAGGSLQVADAGQGTDDGRLRLASAGAVAGLCCGKRRLTNPIPSITHGSYAITDAFWEDRCPMVRSSLELIGIYGSESLLKTLATLLSACRAMLEICGSSGEGCTFPVTM